MIITHEYFALRLHQMTIQKCSYLCILYRIHIFYPHVVHITRPIKTSATQLADPHHLQIALYGLNAVHFAQIYRSRIVPTERWMMIDALHIIHSSAGMRR